MRSVRAEERWASALFVSLSLAALLALAWRSPQSWGIPPCPFFYFTGLFCPGCGTLRAVHALLRGDLVRAFGLNPLLILFLPYIGFFWLSQGVGRRRATRAPAASAAPPSPPLHCILRAGPGRCRLDRQAVEPPRLPPLGLGGLRAH